MTLGSLDLLAPEARELFERYLAEVDARLRPLSPEAADETAEDLREHAATTLPAGATVADVEALTRQLGEPATYASEFAAEPSHPAAAWSSDEPGSGASAPQGRLLGMPYDLRAPSVARGMARWWSPSDRRIVVPRVFGLGWTLNFGAIAVRLGLIEPDAEDVPFTSVPDGTFMVALLVPVALCTTIAVSYLLLRSGLPAALPTHWNAGGNADGFGPQAAAMALVFAIAGLPTLLAAACVALGRSRRARAITIAIAAFFSALSAGIWWLTLRTVAGAPHSPWTPILPLVVAPLGCVFVILLLLARSGRAAEQRRDFSSKEATGR